VDIQFHRDTYDNISQRAIATLAQGLSVFEPVATGPSGATGQPGVDAQHDLHQFFAALYAAMFERPERFGMPTSPDDALNSEREGKERKQKVTQKIKPAQELLDLTLDLLQDLGRKGQVTGEALVVDEATYGSLFEAKGKAPKVILAAMGEVGLAAQAANGAVTLRNARYPQMMPALKAMAERCAAEGDEEGGEGPSKFPYKKRWQPYWWGKLAFARCDLKLLLPDYTPDPLSLLGYFSAEDRARAIALHNDMLATGHQAICQAHPHGWVIQYQGPRKIKGTPLVQIDYSQRHRNPLRVQIKCASTDRLIPYFAEQPPAVQADFRGRVNKCQGASCGWCKNRKGLGPSALTYGGEKLTICWYTRPDLDELTDENLEVLRGYVRWHQRLI
jgi:hypothetical protein